MFEIFVNDETSALESVILGTAESLGGTPTEDQAYDPKSREHILKGTFPLEKDLIKENEDFRKVLEKYGVKVYRPEVLTDTNQVYARDIGFVIGNQFVVPNIIADREHEKEGISSIVDAIPSGSIVRMPDGARAEGGDVIVWKDKIYIGYSEHEDFDKYRVSRTNRSGLDFLKRQFSTYEVLGFELNKSDLNPRENALHLDCCFQPIGRGSCIIYEGGFKNKSDYQLLISHFGKENCIHISQEEMYEMNSNVFSISPEVIVSEQNFHRLNEELENRGFTIEKVAYAQVAKMEGLFRCCTLPLKRSNDGI